MVTRKNFDKTAWVITAVMLVFTILFMNGNKIGIETKDRTAGYETRLFDNSRVHSIDIYMDDWDSFIDSAASEEYSPATLIIDGEAYKNVAIRGKGNTSLSNVASMGSERYSLKVEFDHFDKNKTYYGLDKLALNNLIQDSTMMKDYLTYTMMNAFGANAPLCSFVYITVNGEDWGLYLAVESVEDSFLMRNYGADSGKLYKPDSIGFGGGRGNGREFNMTNFWNENFANKDEDQSGESTSTQAETSMPDMPAMPGGDFDPSQMFGMPGGDFDPSQMPGMPGGDFDPSQMPGGDFDPSQMAEMPGGEGSEGSESGERSSRRRGPGGGGPGGFGGMGSSDVKLLYTDDELDSYSNIWNNAKTEITKSDQKRLIESLKKLSENEDIENVVDIDQVIRYFVVHNYVCNGDSYTGAMIHNYYLYEHNGQLAMIPWDYNLAFGTFQARESQNTVNTPIDSPVSGGMEDRPMINWIFANEEYTEMYHQYFSEFLDTVDIIGIIDAAYDLIAPYVEKDPTAFYTPEEFETGVATLKKFCELRTESIQTQLETGETADLMDYADASDLTISDMGAFGGGGGKDGGMQPPEFGSRRSGESSSSKPSSGMKPPEFNMDAGTENSSAASDETQTPSPEKKPENGEETKTAGPEALKSTDSGEASSSSGQEDMKGRDTQEPSMPSMPGGGMPEGGQGSSRMPGGGMPGGFQQMTPQTDTKTIMIWCGVSLLFLIAGLLIAKKF